jgi:hypothetical protein
MQVAVVTLCLTSSAKKPGHLVGTTTHGILVEIYNYPLLMDGGAIAAHIRN